jgi:hypothetical protein
LTPRFHRWKDVIGDKKAVHRDLTGSIDGLAGNTDALEAIALGIGRAGLREEASAPMEVDDIFADGLERLDDSESDVPSTPAHPSSSLSVPGASQLNESSSSFGSTSSGFLKRSMLPEINAFGKDAAQRFQETEKWRQKKLKLMELQLRHEEEREKRERERDEREADFKKKQLWGSSYAAVVGTLGHEMACEHARRMSGFDERLPGPS